MSSVSNKEQGRVIRSMSTASKAAADAVLAASASGAISSAITSSKTSTSIAINDINPSLQEQQRKQVSIDAEVVAATPAEFAKLSTRSAEAVQRQNGLTDAGDYIRTCICGDSDKCRQLMWGWADLGDDYRHMVQYVWLPTRSKKSTDLALYINKYHDLCAMHMLGKSINAKERIAYLASCKSVMPIAIHHFEKCLRDSALASKERSKTIDKYRCSKELGKEAKLSPNDKCVAAGSYEGEIYYVVPTIVDYSDKNGIEFELNQARIMHQLKLDALNNANKKASSAVSDTPVAKGSFGMAVKPPRRSPEQREFEQSSRKVAANPESSVLEIEELRKKLAASEKALDDMTKGREQDKVLYEKQIKEMTGQFEQLVSTTGMTRMSLLSDKWHEKNHWMTNHLFGFEQWKHFKAFVKRAFFQYKVDVNVKGNERLVSDFEQICMVAMLARRAFRRPTFSGIYGKSPTNITRYLKKWVPICGMIGHCISELPLEKTHNFYDEDMAKEFKVPYVYPDGTVKDYGVV